MKDLYFFDSWTAFQFVSPFEGLVWSFNNRNRTLFYPMDLPVRPSKSAIRFIEW
jgi:hypothetical protein